MERTEIRYMDCVTMDCPYCGKEIIETLSDLTDWDGGYGPGEEDEYTCPHCKKDFIGFLTQE